MHMLSALSFRTLLQLIFCDPLMLLFQGSWKTIQAILYSTGSMCVFTTQVPSPPYKMSILAYSYNFLHLRLYFRATSMWVYMWQPFHFQPGNHRLFESIFESNPSVFLFVLFFFFKLAIGNYLGENRFKLKDRHQWNRHRWQDRWCHL